MLLRGLLHFARRPASHTHLSPGLLHFFHMSPLHSSTALPVKKKLAQLEASQLEQKPALHELVEAHRMHRASPFSSQRSITTDTEWRYLDNVAAALLLPIPAELPPLPPALDKEVFRQHEATSRAVPHYKTTKCSNGLGTENSIAWQLKSLSCSLRRG